MTANLSGLLVVVPTREQVQNLNEGDLAIDCFGKMSKVVRIYARGTDINGKAYICFNTEMGPTSTVSGSLKEDELVSTVPLSSRFTSAELNAIERQHVEFQGFLRSNMNWKPIDFETVTPESYTFMFEQYWQEKSRPNGGLTNVA